MRRALGIDAPYASVGAALSRHGYVQIDPINVCGRMHDLILKNRVAGYREHDLFRHLHDTKARAAFEHYVPLSGTLVAFPVEAYPVLAPHMEKRRSQEGGWAGKLSREERALSRTILREIERRGPLTSDDIDHGARATTGWGTEARMAKTVLEKMFVQGTVLIAARRNFRRVYDLPERVLPAAVLGQKRASEAALRRFLIELRLRQRRLVALKRGELPLVDDLVTAVEIDGLKAHVLREDLPTLDALGEPEPTLRLVAPLDPLIYDRKLTAALWGFDYTWEVYTPPHKRVRGYYALPVLAGDELVGHVDLKADREAGVLATVSKKARRGYVLGPAIEEHAAFLGLRAPKARSGRA